MRPDFVVVSTLVLHFLPGVLKAEEPVRVQAFGSELAVEDSMKLLSVGLPGREKSSTTPFWQAWMWRSRETNSDP